MPICGGQPTGDESVERDVTGRTDVDGTGGMPAGRSPGGPSAPGWPQIPGTRRGEQHSQVPSEAQEKIPAEAPGRPRTPSEAQAKIAGEAPGRPRAPSEALAGAWPRIPGEPPEAGWPQVPGWLRRAAGWSWRLLIVGFVIYVALRMASVLRVVVLPCVAALLFTALLQPLAQRLRTLGLPALAATWCTLLAAVAVLAGAGTLAVTQTSADYPTLVTDVGRTSHDIERWLAGPPFHLRQAGLAQLSDRVLTFLKEHQTAVAGTVLSGGRIFLELLAGLVLMIFVAFFLLKDGERIWGWLTSFLGPEGRRRFHGAGTAAWQALTQYVHGTIAVAAIHAVVIGLALWLLRVPLVIPLIILVFIAAFVPILGFLVAGALAIGVTAATRGWLAAVVLVAIFIIENQLEGHLLQPLVVGRMVRLHPLAIILVLAIGGVVAGIPGAIVAVPTLAALTRAAPHLRGAREEPVVGGDEPRTAPRRE
jgi:predicted PurR-regulated permease PerM